MQTKMDALPANNPAPAPQESETRERVICYIAHACPQSDSLRVDVGESPVEVPEA